MANIQGKYHLISTETQVILRIPCLTHAISIYLDKKPDGTTAEIYQYDQGEKTADGPNADFIKAIEWLSDALDKAQAQA